MAEGNWPADWEQRKAGLDCPVCMEGRPTDNGYGVCYFSVEHADAYLQWITPAPGYSTIFFRGRHVADPLQLSSEETALFWSAVAAVGRAVETVFNPCHLNYQILGNAVPHVHVHLVPRYLTDSAPGRPLGERTWDSAPRLSTDVMEEQVAALVRALGH